MTSWECYENKWIYMKYIGKMVQTESLLSTCCTSAKILLDVADFNVRFLSFYRIKVQVTR